MSLLNHLNRQLYTVRGKAFVAVAGLFAAIVSLVAAATQLALPAVAFAQETTTTINGTMVVKLQESTAKSVIASTGDALGFLIAGIVILMFGVLYLVLSSRKTAKVTGAHGSSAKHGVQTISKKAIIIAVVAAMLASCCFGMFANRQATIAAEIVSQTNSTVLVDNNVKVLNSSIVVENAGEYPVTVTGVTAPTEMNDWTASVVGDMIAPNNNVKGTWSGIQISDDLLKQLKAHKGEVELTYTVDLNCEDGMPYDLDFEKFTVDTANKTYQASQIKPAVTAEGYTEGVDYTVTFGENVNAGEDVGTITITGIGNFAGEKTYTFTIDQKQVKVANISAKDKVFDGTTDAEIDYSAAAFEGICEGDTLTVTGDKGKFADANVGENKEVTLPTYSLSGDKAANYQLSDESQKTATASITAASLNFDKFTVDTESKTYQASQIKPAVSADGYTEGVDYIVTYGENVNAGDNTGTITITGTGNYAGEKTYTFTINKKTVKVANISAKDKVFDGTADAEIDYSAATFEGICEGDTLTVTGDKGKFADANVGENKEVTLPTYSLSGDKAANYQLSDESQKTATASITAASLNFDKFTVDTESKTYQASQIRPAVTAEGYTEGVDYTVTYGENVNVGENAGTIKITGIGNYSGEKEYTFHINKKIVTITGIKALDREYDGTSDVDFDCSEAQINGLCEGDTLEVIAGGELDEATVGKRTAKVLSLNLVGDLSFNYGIEEFTSIDLSMEITQRTAELTWYSTSFKYDGTTHQPIASVSNSLDGEVPVVTVEGGQSAAGTYTATATAIDDTNYKLPDSVTQEFTISPLKVSVSGISAEDKVYDRTTDATFDATHASLDGIKEGDDVALDVTNAKCKFESADAGENKKVTISGLTLSGAAKDNYVFEQEGAQLTTTATISKKAIGVAWTGSGQYTYNGQVQMPSAAADGEVLGDEVNLTVAEKDGAICKNVGSYTAKVTSIDNPNYEFKLGAGTTFSFRIVQKSVQVLDISARNKKYDGTTTAKIDYTTATFNGIIDGDKLSVSGGDGTFESAEIGQNITVHLPEYTLGGADAANYYMSGISQNVAYANITEQELDYTFFDCDAPDQVYSKTKYKPTVTCSNPDYVEGRDYEVSYDDNTDVGTGYVYVEGIGNYGGLVAFDFEIKPRDLDVVWTKDDIVYDGNAHVPAAAADPDDLLDGDSAEISVKTTDGQDAIEIGEYKAEATSQNPNYVASDATKTHTFWISKAEYCTVSFSMNGHGDNLAPVTVLKGEKVPEPTDVPSVAGLKFEGWYSQELCLDKWDFDKDVPMYGDYTLYANWVPDTDADVYWISPASKITTGNTTETVNQANENYRKEEWCVKKSSAEIKADVAVLQDATNEKYDEVKAEYEAFMKNDDFHLYTKWTGDTSDSAGAQAANGYVEFRIIQVGKRDADEALTFQAIHELTTAYQMMQTSNTNKGGWGSSELQAMLNPGGEIYANFNTAFTDDIAAVAKKTYAGYGASTASYSCNYFWLPSYVELSGTRDMHYEEECQPQGDQTQYTFYRTIGVSDSGNNPSLMFNTRAGNRPVGAPTEYDTSTPWWTRSSTSQTLTDYKAVNYKGNMTEFSPFSNSYYGVTPCFSFGKRDGNIVTFDMQNHGKQVYYSYVPTGKTIKVPEPGAEGYGRQTGLKLEGWYTNATCKPADKWDFSNTVDTNMTLYANWVLDEDATRGNSYWIGTSYKVINQATSSGKGNSANYVSETTNVLKTQEEIRRDVQKIKAGDEATKEYYTEIMNGDAYHLYTKWNGDTKKKSGKEDAKLGYVEFRIIGVGSHDGDGSGLTFQAVHTLQFGYKVNSSVWGYDTFWGRYKWIPTNQYGWAECDMRTAMNYDKDGNAGDILKNFSQGFIDDIYRVQKKTMTGARNTDLKTSTDVMWNLAYVEITGTKNGGYMQEGEQYEYFKNIGYSLSDSKSWTCLTRRTRAWDKVPAALPKTNTFGASGQWWLRSPHVATDSTYIAVSGSGSPNLECDSNLSYGVCPAFCL